MKVTLKKLTIGTILSFILYVAILLMFFSCRTAKKTWVNENFASKQDISKLETTQLNSQKTLESKITNSLIIDFTEKLKLATEKTTNNETETTTTQIDIIAENGVEKKATAGNTTVTSNGANVSVQTTSSKALSKEFESKYQELSQKLDKEQKYNEHLYSEINSLKSEIANLRSTYQSEKQAKTKETTKRGFTFWAVIIGGLIVVLGVAGYVFRSRITFF